MEGQLLTIEEAAKRIGKPPRTIRYMCLKGEWARYSFKVQGGKREEWRIPLAAVEEFEREHPVYTLDSTAHLPKKVDERHLEIAVTAETIAEILTPMIQRAVVEATEPLKQEVAALRTLLAQRDVERVKSEAKQDRILAEVIKGNEAQTASKSFWQRWRKW